MSQPGNNDADNVHERPAWLVPAAVGIAVLALSGVLMTYYLWPVIAPRLGLLTTPSAAAELVRIQVGDQGFEIPRNYLRNTATGPSGGDAVLHAVLPRLEPYGPETAEAFEDRGGASPVVTMTLSPRGGFLPDADRFDLVYSRHLATDGPEEILHGLQRFSFEPDSGYAAQDLFLGTAEGGSLILLLCYRGGPGLPPASCSRSVGIGDGDTVLTYRFRRIFLPDWEEIDTGVTAMVAGFALLGTPL